MKGRILTSCVILVSVCGSGYAWNITMNNGNNVYIISSPAELSMVPGNAVLPFEIWINNGGVYSFAELDDVSRDAEEVRINFDMDGGGSNPMLVFDVDSGFDGEFDARFKVEQTIRLRLDSDLLRNGADGDDIIHFANIDSGSIPRIFIVEGDSGVQYVYEPETCTNGDPFCFKRHVSNTHIEEEMEVYHEQRLRDAGVQYNLGMLLRPVNIVNRNELFGLYDFSDEFFVSVAPEYHLAKDFHNFGMRLNSGTKFGGRLFLGVGAYVFKSYFKNDVSDFSANIYGGNLRYKYNINDVLFLRGVGGFSFADINFNGIRDDGTVVNNPGVFGFYGGTDLGAKFDFQSGLFLSPFVGYAIQRQGVMGVHETDSYFHFGSDVGFKYFMDGVTYSYVLRGGIDLHGDIDANIGIGAWTVADKIGGTVSVGIMNTDFGFSGKVSADVRLAF